MRTVCWVLSLCAGSLTAAERPAPAVAGSSSHQSQTLQAEHLQATIDAHPPGAVTSVRSVPSRVSSVSEPVVTAISAPGATGAATVAVGSTSMPAESAVSTFGSVASTSCTGCVDALQPSHGERSRLEAEKQLLTLQIDVATLRKKLKELEAGPLPAAGSTGAAVIMMEPPPTVLARRGFDGHFSALLRMSSGGNLVVHAGDRLPSGRIDAIDGLGVLATWYGRHVRLMDAEADESGSSAGLTSRSLDLTLPAAPTAVSAR